MKQPRVPLFRPGESPLRGLNRLTAFLSDFAPEVWQSWVTLARRVERLEKQLSERSDDM